ncbi:MAG: hypothetical protein DRG78_24060 [Epsilonproteobacteria bacterium]|nr:MAG: hypothetical protein DRG78_24060 [Campylobacterota bacterium]
MPSSNNNISCFANIIVISMIPVMFFSSMLLGYLDIIHVNIPLHALLIVGFILFIFILFIKHNANYTICKMHSSCSTMQEKLTQELELSSLELNEKKKSILNIDKFLQNYYSGIRNDNFVSVASSVFPMLGILGTFTAIAISMPNFSVTDTKALDNEISILLSGVGSAFFASIFGILLSLIWIYFEKRGLSKVDRFFLDTKNSFKEYIWSQDELTLYKYQQYKPKDEKFIDALKETFNLDFIKNINEQSLSNFKSSMQDTNENFSQLTKRMESASSDLIATLNMLGNNTDAINTRNQIDKTIVNFTDAIKSFDETVKENTQYLDNSLNKTFEKIDTEIGDIIIKLADFATHVSLESKEVQDSIGKYHYMIAKQLRVK